MIRRCLAGLAVLFGGLTMMGAAEPIVILIGLDGFRADALERFRPPQLTEMARSGSRAEFMSPVFPSLTFPNFYTLVTGLRPARHGIIGNSMFDPVFNARFSLGSPAVLEGRWWEGEPLWVTAEKQGVRSACMFWPGSEAEIAGVRPSEWRKFDSKIPAEERVREVLAWLARPEAERPRLITLYFHEADTAGHRFGPDSAEVGDAVALVDTALGQLREGVNRLGLDGVVNYVVVSDHGMTTIDPDRVIALATLIDLNKVQVDFTGAIAGLRPREGVGEEEIFQALQAKAQSFAVYRRDDLPEGLHFRDHRRIPPLLLLANEGWYIQTYPVRSAARDSFPKGAHGFDPGLDSMKALFLASGPLFKEGLTIPAFENIQVYNLVCAALGLKPAENDGDDRLVRQILREDTK